MVTGEWSESRPCPTHHSPLTTHHSPSDSTMSQLQDRIAQFRKMASDDPDNELGHFRLGQLLSEAGDHAEAVKSFERTLELSPGFSKVFQLLGQSLLKLGKKAEAIDVWTRGWKVA